ncbi:MAG: family 16 glycoside hydrolase [Nitrososphaerales archaeon]
MPPRPTKFEGRKKRYAIAISLGVVVVSIAAYLAAEPPYKNSQTWSFDQYTIQTYDTNISPDGFQALITGSGEKGEWIIINEKSAPSAPNILAHLSLNASGSGYPVLIAMDKKYSDFKATLKFKIVGGEENQVAGIAFRVLDKKHYYALAVDALNDRITLFRVSPDIILGISETKVELSKDEWHTLVVEVFKTGMFGYLDGEQLIKRHDKEYSNGYLGVWTKNDSEVYFDDLKIEY